MKAGQRAARLGLFPGCRRVTLLPEPGERVTDLLVVGFQRLELRLERRLFRLRSLFNRFFDEKR